MSQPNPNTHANPPLAFTNDAIVNQLRHQATNGPAYVQHSATKALAHIKGLYANAHFQARLAYDTARLALRDAVQDAVDHVKQKAEDGKMSVAERVAGLMDGTLTPTAEELAHFDRAKPAGDDDDEAHETEQEDEPP